MKNEMNESMLEKEAIRTLILKERYGTNIEEAGTATYNERELHRMMEIYLPMMRSDK